MAGQNSWIKSGFTRPLLGGSDSFGNQSLGVTTTGTGKFQYKDSPYTTYQAVLTGTGALTASINIEYSNDGVNPCATVGGTISLSGTTTVSDGFTSNSPWKYVRANVTAISGTGATVQVWMGV